VRWRSSSPSSASWTSESTALVYGPIKIYLRFGLEKCPATLRERWWLSDPLGLRSPRVLSTSPATVWSIDLLHEALKSRFQDTARSSLRLPLVSRSALQLVSLLFSLVADRL
jgi:hypothetical protein